MNWYSVFYWVTRADSIKKFFDSASTLFSWAASLSFVVLVIITILAQATISQKKIKTDVDAAVDPDYRSMIELRKYFSWFFYSFLFLSIVTWVGYVFTPTKKETLLIIAGGGTMQFLTTDSSAKKIPSELSNFVVTELQSMAKEAKVDLGLATQKDKVLEEVKQMTSREILIKMKEDSNFAKIVLEK